MPTATNMTTPESLAVRQSWDLKYSEGPTPWDTRITPPEVVEFWQSRSTLPASGPTRPLALDLGCGTGTNAAWLVEQGLNAIGCEISSVALSTAASRHRQHLQSRRLRLLQADVTALPLDRANAAYILDIGCLHGLPLSERPAYAQGVIANLTPGGNYHLFAFDRTPDSSDDLRGLAPGELESLFVPQLQIVQAFQARPDMRPCHWYLLHKPSAQEKLPQA